MAITANVNSSTAFAPWGFTRLANCAVTPSCAISTKDRGARDRGRPKTHDGKVHWDDLSRFERVQSEEDDVVLYHQVLNHVHLRRNPGSSPGQVLRVVLVGDTHTQRRAILFSTDTDLDAQTLYRGYKARFQIEFLFRDAKQFTSLNACQATPGLDPGQAACSLQCQYECSDLGQAGSGDSKAAVPRQGFPWQASNGAPSTNICLSEFLNI